MAGGMDVSTGGGGGKKPLDTPINLVPFIDLMAVTISFLIMTAVWTQVGRLEVGSSAAGPPTTQAEEPEVPLVVALSSSRLVMTVGWSDEASLPLQRDGRRRLDLTAFRARLEALGSRRGAFSTVTVRADDDVRYEDLVHVLDTCMAAGIAHVTVEASS